MLKQSLLSLQSNGCPRVVLAGDFNVPDIMCNSYQYQYPQYTLFLSLSLKAFFVRNPKDHSIEDNWKFIQAGLMEMLNKKVPKKKLGTWRDTP